MLEDLITFGYRDFYHAVPQLGDLLERSHDVRLLGFTGSATIGSHDATFYSLLRHPSRRRRLRVLLLSPLSVRDMLERRKTTGHSPEQYTARIFATLETLKELEDLGSLDVQVRLYERDPQWYFWILDSSVLLDSHALGVGRRSPRIQITGPERDEAPEVFAELFENAWTEPGNRNVDFENFAEELRCLRREARAVLEQNEQGGGAKDVAGPTMQPSVWNVICETYWHPADVLPQLRRELERTFEFFYYGSNGQTRFNAKTADLAEALVCGAQGTSSYRISLVSPESDEALLEKVRASTSGRSLESTRRAILETLGVLGDLRREHRLDLEVRLRQQLGSTRLYLFDRSVCLSSFHAVGGMRSTCLFIRERQQDLLLSFFRKHFLESWERARSTDLDQPVRPSASSPRDKPPAIVFDADRLVLTIGRDPVDLTRGVLLFLRALACERGAYLPLDEDIDGRPARRRRADLGNRVGTEMARKIVETTQGLGYRFQRWVSVRRRDDRFRGGFDMDRFPDEG